MKNNKKVRRKLLTWLAVLIVFCLGAQIMNFTDFRKEEIEVPVQESNFSAQFFYADSVRPVINKYKDATVRSSPVITVENPGIWLKLLAPSTIFFLFDPLLSLLIIIISLTGIFLLRNFNYDQPFTRSFSKAIYWAAMFCLCFWVLNLLRLYWISDVIRHLTNDRYQYKSVQILAHLEFWLGILLYWLSFILKKGEAIQKEQELTI